MLFNELSLILTSILQFHCSPKLRLLSVIQLRDVDPLRHQARQHEAGRDAGLST